MGCDATRSDRQVYMSIRHVDTIDVGNTVATNNRVHGRIV